MMRYLTPQHNFSSYFLIVAFNLGVASGHAQQSVEFFHQGNEQVDLKNLDSAAVLFGLAEAKSRDEGNREIEAKSLNEIGLVLAETKRLKKANEKFEKSARLAEQIGDTVLWATALNNYAGTQIRQGNTGEALRNITKSIDLKELLGNEKEVVKGRLNLAALAYSIDSLEMADSIVSKALTKSIEFGDTTLILSALNTKGLVLLALEQYSTALEWFDKAESYCEEPQRDYEMISILDNQALCFEGVGDYRNALRIRKRRYELNNSFLTESLDLELDKLELDVVRAQSALEKAQANATLAQTQLTAQKNQNNLLLLISALLIAGVFLFMRFRKQNAIQRARTEAVMQTREQEEERISQLLWTEIGKAMKQRGESSTSVFKGDAKTLDGAVQAARYLSAQHFNPYLQVGLARAVEYACELFGTQYQVTVEIDVEDVPVPFKQRSAMYKTFKHALVDHLDAPGIQVVHVTLKNEDGKADFTILSDHPPKQSALFKSAEAEVEALGGKLKYKPTGEGHRTRIKLPYQG